MKAVENSHQNARNWPILGGHAPKPHIVFSHCTGSSYYPKQFIKTFNYNIILINKGVFKRGGVQTPPQKIFRFFLKSEGKEIEKKGMLVGGGEVTS